MVNLLNTKRTDKGNNKGGKRDGKIIEYYLQIKEELNYKDGIQDGKIIKYYEN